MSRGKRPDGRPRSLKDKGYINLFLASGEDPADPAVRAREVAMWLRMGFDQTFAEDQADKHLDDLRWGLAGFPLV